VQAQSYDAIVVGSGISGGWAAKELTEKGLRVLLLERGKNVEHIKDYVKATKAPWQYPIAAGRTRAMELATRLLKRDYPLNEKNLDWWASDLDSPYTEVKRFDWYRRYHVGGPLAHVGPPELSLEATSTSRLTRGGGWRSTGRSGTRTSLPGTITSSGTRESRAPGKGSLNCRTDNFSRPWRSTAARRRSPGGCNGDLAACVGSSPAARRNLTRPRRDFPLSVPHACWLGCPYMGVLQHAILHVPRALATGRLTAKPFAIVTEVLYDRDRKRAPALRAGCVTDQTTDYTARASSCAPRR